jgi:hypothetical protein
VILVGALRRLGRQPAVLAEDRLVELLQRRAGLDPELVEQRVARPLVRGECLRLPAGAVKREQLLGT